MQLTYRARRLVYKFAELLSCLGALAVCVLILLTRFGRYPYFELTVHFRLQYALGSLFFLILLIAFRRRVIGLALLICAAFNFWHILPYYVAAPHRVNGEKTQKLRLMTANLAMRNENYEAFRRSVEISAPDVLVLQEVTEEWSRELVPLQAVYPYSEIVPKQGGAGLALLSRHPLESAQVLFAESSMHPALLGVVNLDGTRLTVLVLHPLTPMRRDKFANRNEQLKQVALLIKAAPEPKLLAGDLNTTMWSPYYADLVKDSGLHDARLGRGLYPTWDTTLPPFLGIPIDHCLTSDTIEIENFEIGPATGSDHRPLVIDMKIEKKAESE